MALHIRLTASQGPRDVSALGEVLKEVAPEAIRMLAVLGKTEGPASLEDRSRHEAHEEAATVIREAGGDDLLERSWRIFSTGCEGIATPVCIAIADTGPAEVDVPGAETGFAWGAARSNPVADAERCTRAHVAVAADCVREAMANGSIAAGDVDLVFVKSPIRQSPSGLGGRLARSTGGSRGAAALGVAVALGECDLAALPEDPVLSVPNFASRTMAFSGTETDCVEAIVFGRRKGGDRDWLVTQAVLNDFLDVDAMKGIEKPEGFEPQLVFFKAGIPRDGRLRGRRTTVLTSELPADKQLRAAASGLVGSVFGSTASFISGGAEHQGPDGACLCSVLWRRR